MTEVKDDQSAQAEAAPVVEARSEEGESGAEPKRRVRRTRQVAASTAAQAGGDARDEAAKPDRERPSRERQGAPREGNRRRGRFGDRKRTEPAKSGERRSPIVGSQRTVYRQDVVATAPQAGDRRDEPREAKPSGQAAPDRLTLILHPAPKAAPTRRAKANKPLTAKEALKARLAKQGGAQKKGEKAAQPAAAASLDPAWLEAGPDDALSVLASAGAGAEKLVQGWLDKGNAAAIARAAADGSGPARKAARRALNVLRARGVSVPEPQVAAPKPTAVDEPEECTASFIPPDGSGTTFFSFSQRMPGGRYRVADILVRERAGVVHASSGALAGKHIRRWRERVEQRFGTRPIDVPLEWARWAVAEARRMNDTSSELVPLGYDSCLPLIAPPPAEAPPHPVADLESTPFESVELERARLDSEKLHDEPEFRGWLVEDAAIDEVIQKIVAGIQEGDGEEHRDKVFEDELLAGTDRHFTPERRAQLAAQMRDTAISVRRRRGPEMARRVLAVAEAIRQAGLVTSPPREIPFLVALVRKGIAAYSMARARTAMGRTQPGA